MRSVFGLISVHTRISSNFHQASSNIETDQRLVRNNLALFVAKVGLIDLVFHRNCGWGKEREILIMRKKEILQNERQILLVILSDWLLRYSFRLLEQRYRIVLFENYVCFFFAVFYWDDGHKMLKYASKRVGPKETGIPLNWTPNRIKNKSVYCIHAWSMPSNPLFYNKKDAI